MLRRDVGAAQVGLELVKRRFDFPALVIESREFCSGLALVVQNGGGEGNPDGPTGVRVEMQGRAFVPEPSGLVLAFLGLMPLLLLRRTK